MLSYDLEQFVNDPEKQRSRDLIREQVEKTFPGDRSNLRVAFFTGPSLKESEIYEKAGIKPGNIYGIERDSEAFNLAQLENQRRSLEKKIVLYHGDFERFVRHGTRLDVISLDYIQTYGSEVINGINSVFDTPGILADKTLLVVNTQARREAAVNQMRLRFLTFAGMALNGADAALWCEVIDEISGSPKKFDRQHLENMDEILVDTLMGPLIQRHKGVNVKSTEYLAYSRYGLFQEVLIRAAYPLLRGLQGVRIDDLFYNEHFGEEVKKAGSEEKRESFRFLAKALDDILVEKGDSLSDPVRLAYVGSLSSGRFFPLLFKMLSKNLPMPNIELKDKQKIHSAYLYNRSVARMISSYSTFSYTSQSKTPMLMHFFNLERAHKLDEFVEGMQGGQKTRETAQTFNNLFFSMDLKYKEFRNFLVEKFGRVSMKDIFSMDVKTLKSFRAGQEIINKFFSKEGKNEKSSISKFMKETTSFIDRDITFQMQESKIMLEYVDFVKGIGSKLREEELSKIEKKKSRIEGENMNEPKKELEYKSPGKSLEEPAPGLSIDGYLDRIKDKYLNGDADQRFKVTKGLEKVIGNINNGDTKFENLSDLSPEDKNKIRKMNLDGKTPKEIHTTHFKESNVSVYQIAAICAWNKIWRNKYPDRIQVS